MFHILPEEILTLIIQKIDIDPVSIYNLRNINQQFKKTIENLSHPDISEYNINKTSQKITELCKKQPHLNTFKWLSKNANNYGFYMSYSKNNNHGIMYEPWHWMFKNNVD